MCAVVDDLSWQYIGVEFELMKHKCQHLFAKTKKKDDLVLLFSKDKFYAMEAWCGHLGGPLYQGDIEDYQGTAHVMCPWHGYMFDLESGKNDLGLIQQTFETKIEDCKVYVKYKCELSLHPYL